MKWMEKMANTVETEYSELNTDPVTHPYMLLEVMIKIVKLHNGI